MGKHNKDKKISNNCGNNVSCKGENTCADTDSSGDVSGGTNQSVLKDLLLRTQANFENYKKQSEKRMQEMQKHAAKDIITQILPVLDNFELALKNADTNSNPQDFVAGLELIYSQLSTMLTDNKVQIIPTTNQQFDPNFHEALLKQPSKYEENIIIEEFQKGYMLNGAVLRCAKVKISAGKIDLTKHEKNNDNKQSTKQTK